ncbi:hypothetical protein [Paenibacillus lutrae]|uniref:hypothetical protein n=1 Tax=Paenibacillus lutrae TaxID=2078573 RepID=UPI0012FCE992|nr:hypothetical protein [Paenibacillus lutrae]
MIDPIANPDLLEVVLSTIINYLWNAFGFGANQNIVEVVSTAIVEELDKVVVVATWNQ